jgi:nucleoside-diphosphate-sugar epimerase
MRALITGATGFLGTRLTMHLLASGMSVRVLARAKRRATPLIELGADLVEGEITDPRALRHALDDVTIVYHLAGKLFLPGVPAAEYRRIHVAGTRALLAQCHERAQLERFVHCSTTGVLGVTGDRPADETAASHPTNAYEESKLEGELLVRDAMQQGLPAVIVRPGLVYGPGDLHLLGFFRAVCRGVFRPIGRRPVWLHPIYVDDMAEAFVSCCRSPEAVGECFHIAQREPVTLATLAATVADALGVAPPHGYIPRPMALAVAAVGELLPARMRQRAPLTRSRLEFLTHSRVYDVSKAQRLLDFTASMGLRKGIARTTAWYIQQGYLSPDRVADHPRMEE